MKYYLGIDPGLSGALAFFEPERDKLDVYDMPTHEVTVAGKVKRTIDMHMLAALIRDAMEQLIPEYATIAAIIEKVNAMPKQGVTSSFNFGFNCGCAQMAVCAFQIPLTLVSPSSWKKSMGVTADKSESRRAASMAFPVHAHKWPLKKHDGRAEAALLARYLWEREPMSKNKPKMEDLI